MPAGEALRNALSRSSACRAWVIGYCPMLFESARAVASVHQMCAQIGRSEDRYGDFFETRLAKIPKHPATDGAAHTPKNPTEAADQNFAMYPRDGWACLSSLKTFRALSVDNRSFRSSESLATMTFAGGGGTGFAKSEPLSWRLAQRIGGTVFLYACRSVCPSTKTVSRIGATTLPHPDVSPP